MVTLVDFNTLKLMIVIMIRIIFHYNWSFHYIIIASLSATNANINEWLFVLTRLQLLTISNL